MTKQDLMDSPEFEAALLEGAELKKSAVGEQKTQGKATYERFYETMLNARDDVKAVLAKRRKSRSEADKELLKKFKQETAKSYRQTCDFLVPEQVEEGRMTKIEKLVDKIASSINVLRYIDGKPGANVLEKAFAKRGITLGASTSLEAKSEFLKSNDVRKNVEDIFKQAVALKQKAKDSNEAIGVSIYTEKVPPALQYDKDTNNAGIKPGDFKKLVDLKAKLIQAKTDDAKAKADEKLKNAAADKQFEAARAELVRDKITSMA